MNIDNREFIERHFRDNKDQEPTLPPPKRLIGRSVWVVGIIFTIIVMAFLALFSLEGSNPAQLIALCFAIGTAFSAVFIVRALGKKSKKERYHDLLTEIIEGSRGARLVTDSANGTLLCNKKFERLCRGVGPTSLKTLQRLLSNPEDSKQTFQQMIDKAQSGHGSVQDIQSLFEDRVRWFNVTAQPVAGYPGYVHWRLDDVTQQHTVDKAIREEREKLIDFTDNAPVGFFSVDEKGRFVFANATFARWLGEDLRNLLSYGELHTYLVEPPQNGNPYDLTEESAARQVVEIKMKGTGGKTFLASINQIIVMEQDGSVRTRAVVRDLTAEREIRKALEASEDRFQRFFEEAPLGIVQLDEHGNVSDCNNAFARMLGMDAPDVQGSQFDIYLSPQDHDKVMLEIGRMSDDVLKTQSIEVILEGKGNKRAATQVYARQFKGSHSTILHFIDVTEKKSLEAQFVQSQKMQAIGQLAGGVAHDFNNLLTAIIGYCDLLMIRHKPGDPSFSDIKQVEQNAQRASGLVKQLLAFSRQQTLQTKLHDPADILTEVSQLLRRLLGVTVDLEVVHGRDIALIKVDEQQMDQVLMNLAVNARDAMNGKGRLTIQTENYSNESPVELVAEELPAGNWVRMTVTDTGCGIEPDNLARIFEPFFTTKDVGEGTGLGLATVYGIVRQTGGFLDVQSIMGQGTSFIIYLPQATQSQQIEAANEAAEEKKKATKTQDLTGSERILLVEDEDAVRTFSQRALANKGYEVFAAENGDAAWEMFENNEIERLDLMVTDVVMPGMDGSTLAKKVAEKHPDLKIIFMSGYTEDKLKDENTGQIHFLPKPFTLKQLAAKVKEVLEE